MEKEEPGFLCCWEAGCPCCAFGGREGHAKPAVWQGRAWVGDHPCNKQPSVCSPHLMWPPGLVSYLAHGPRLLRSWAALLYTIAQQVQNLHIVKSQHKICASLASLLCPHYSLIRMCTTFFSPFFVGNLILQFGHRALSFTKHFKTQQFTMDYSIQ